MARCAEDYRPQNISRATRPPAIARRDEKTKRVHLRQQLASKLHLPTSRPSGCIAILLRRKPPTPGTWGRSLCAGGSGFLERAGAREHIQSKEQIKPPPRKVKNRTRPWLRRQALPVQPRQSPHTLRDLDATQPKQQACAISRSPDPFLRLGSPKKKCTAHAKRQPAPAARQGIAARAQIAQGTAMRGQSQQWRRPALEPQPTSVAQAPPRGTTSGRAGAGLR